MESGLTEIGGRPCHLHGREDAKFLLIQPTDRRGADELKTEAAYIRGLAGDDFLLCGFETGEWDTELSPWEAPPVFGGRGFGNGAFSTLEYIERSLMPAIAAPGSSVLLGGYSLAGLFAAWAGCVTDAFSGVAAVSPSLWFPGWLDFAETHPPRAGYMYLSLGDREEKTKNQVTSLVGDAVRREYRLLRETFQVTATLEWNPGNHFFEPERRTAKGFAWLLNEMRK